MGSQKSRICTRRDFIQAMTGTVLGLTTLGMSQAARIQGSESLMLGGLINDYVARHIWGPYWQSTDPLGTMRENGLSWMTSWLYTTSSSYLANTPPEKWSSLPWRDEYWASLEYVTHFFKKISADGYRFHLLLGFSDQHPYPCHQIIPAEWRDLSDGELSNAVQGYAYQTAQHFIDEDLNVELYTLGNEIEFGILNTLPGQNCVPPGIDVFTDLNYLRQFVWPLEARLLRSAIQGISEANPTAMISLHPNSVGKSRGHQHLKAFLYSMLQGNVEFDYVSYTYPQPEVELIEGTRPYYHSFAFSDLMNFTASIGKQALIGECFYPHSSNRIIASPDPGYPFSPEGQAKWLRDFLSFSGDHNVIAGLIYWYPEYFPGYSMDLSLSEDYTGLFLSETEPSPAMEEFRKYA